MSAGGKGSARRPGELPPGAWEAIFKPREPKDGQMDCIKCPRDPAKVCGYCGGGLKIGGGE